MSQIDRVSTKIVEHYYIQIKTNPYKVQTVKRKKAEMPQINLPRKWERVKRAPWSFSSKISQSPRKDGEDQSKITLAKRFIDHILEQDGPVEGTYFVEKYEDEMRIFFDKSKLPDHSTLIALYSARWITLTCPFCGKPARPPLFKNEYASGSEILLHECEAEYFCDLEYNDTSFEPVPIMPEKESRWLGVIIHNYDVFTGLVGFALNNDFDVLHPSARLNHVIFRVRKKSKIGRLGYTTTDVHGNSVTILFDGPIRM